MSYLKKVIQFGWPYMAAHWRRLALGLLLGVFFGFSNALILAGARHVLDRLSVGAEVQEVVASASAPEVVNAPAETETSTLESISDWKQELFQSFDAWLPLAGRDLDFRQILGLMLFLPALMAIRGFLGYGSTYCLAWVGERVINALRLDVLIKLTSLSLDFFNRSTSGDLVSRVNSDTRYLHRALSMGVADIVKEPVTIIGVMAYLIWLDWQLTLVVFLFLPVLMAPVIILGKKLQKAAKNTVLSNVDHASLLIEFLAGIRVVKAFHLEKQQIGKFRDLANRLIHHGMKIVQSRELINPLIETLAGLGFGLLILWVFHTGRELADMVIFLGAVGAVYTPIKRLSRLHALFLESSAGVDRLIEIFEQKPSVAEPEHPKDMESFHGDLSFHQVSFRYEDHLVLQDLDLTVRKGEKIGIAGESGSGKSTLVNLAFRFFDPTSGSVSVDGHDLRTLRTLDFRSQMALVSQDVVLFNTTVAENIGLGREGSTRDEIEAAARAAFAHDFIMGMPQAYDTIIGERGVKLSGGQRQRLSIARAFVRDAPILVLDEATAALDSQSESEVQVAIDNLAKNRTVICVAHRLSTLRSMDRIIVLSQGRIVEEGSFQQLIDQKGYFALMAQGQGMDASGSGSPRS